MSYRCTLVLLFGVLLLTSCTSSTQPQRPDPLVLPTPLAVDGPAIPFREPNIRGEQTTYIRPIADVAALLSCLESRLSMGLRCKIAMCAMPRQWMLVELGVFRGAVW
jgi:hypothetical protein